MRIQSTPEDRAKARRAVTARYRATHAEKERARVAAYRATHPEARRAKAAGG